MRSILLHNSPGGGAGVQYCNVLSSAVLYYTLLCCVLCTVFCVLYFTVMCIVYCELWWTGGGQQPWEHLTLPGSGGRNTQEMILLLEWSVGLFVHWFVFPMFVFFCPEALDWIGDMLFMSSG